jgi:nucleoside-diphosphate-sugar epimerase
VAISIVGSPLSANGPSLEFRRLLEAASGLGDESRSRSSKYEIVRLRPSAIGVRGDHARSCCETEEYWGNVNPIGPRSCYDEGKRCAETLFFDYYRQHNLSIKVARNSKRF